MSPTGVLGGAERALVGLARELPRQGTAVAAVLLEDGPLAGELAAAGCPTSVGSISRTRDPRSVARGIAAVRAALADDVDVVVSNHPKGHLHGGVAAWSRRRPAVLWQHGFPARSALERVAALVPIAAVVCPGAAAAQAQRALTPRQRIVTIPSGVDVAGLRRASGTGAAVRRDAGWEGALVVGIVGRLQPWKGQEVFLRAAAHVAAEVDAARFLVVGGDLLGTEGAYVRRLESLVDELGLAGRVRFTGHQADIGPWYDAMDVVVHASTVEPFGLVVVEAMALGRAVVASREGGPAEIIEDGVSGMLLPPGSPDGLASGVLALLRDPERRSALGTAAAARAEVFSVEATARDFADLLADVVASR